MKLTRTFLAAAAAVLTFSGQAQAQDKIVLKYSHVFPTSHYLWVEDAKRVIDSVTKATGGRVVFEPYHAGQLGKEGSTVLASGLADVAMLVPSYEGSKMPLTTVAELPGFHSSSCEGTAKLWSLAKDGGALNDAEFKPMGIKVLNSVVLTPYQLMTTKTKISTVADVKGMKIRANGAAMDKAVRALGGVPVRVTSNEFYDALSRGTIDGGFWPIGATRMVGAEKQFKYTVQGTQLGGGSVVMGMRQKVWDGLPEDVKSALSKAAMEAQQHLCKYLDDEDDKEGKILVKDHGLTVTTLSKDEADRWNKLVRDTAQSWAKEMDDSKRPGSAMLKAYSAASGK